MSSAGYRKEPSMDEILASIRRIIESSDDKPSAAKSEGAVSRSEPIEDTVLSSANDAAPSVPRFDVHYLTASSQRTGQLPDDLDWDVNPRDQAGEHASGQESVAADAASFDASEWELRSTNDPAGSNRPVAEEGNNEAYNAGPSAYASPSSEPQAENQNGDVAARHPETETHDPSDFAFEFDDAALEEALNDDAWRQPARQPETAIEVERPVAAAAVEPVEPVSVEASPEAGTSEVPPPIPESVIAGASALLSMQAGDQVARAFDDLTHAIREGHMRSMEGMAREILRPMLQEWLEDNLPNIVERLVREEIERVARGPRR